MEKSHFRKSHFLGLARKSHFISITKWKETHHGNGNEFWPWWKKVISSKSFPHDDFSMMTFFSLWESHFPLWENGNDFRLPPWIYNADLQCTVNSHCKFTAQCAFTLSIYNLLVVSQVSQEWLYKEPLIQMWHSLIPATVLPSNASAVNAPARIPVGVLSAKTTAKSKCLLNVIDAEIKVLPKAYPAKHLCAIRAAKIDKTCTDFCRHVGRHI